MKFIKLGVISIVILFLLLTSLGLLLPSTVRVTRNITLQTSMDSLHSYLDDISQWKQWMEGLDSSVVVVSQTANGKSVMATINKQSVSITKDTKDRIETLWQTSRGKAQRCVFELSFDTATSATNLNWYFEQKLSWYPWERLPALANDKVLGPFMEHSLDKLKALTEGNKN